ncbi:Sulfotransferase domain protein [Rubripirellula amarantea]|uniref:Sulfotransferase domain protein n=1 Tax=Rubripirellula amarantea TaxID=2527999 RepID=A0A5C5WRA0_9BACT|nr:sulfotransferase [Rubripirellula amarantea]TWT52641.1 Sulfotransferase domain protein [Rubripirellula amarantea]
MTPILDRPVFVVGVPRSGTTVMSTLLSSSPTICIAPEIWFFNYWMQKYDFLDLSDRNSYTFFVDQFLASKRFRYLELDAQPIRDQLINSDVQSFQSVFSTVLTHYADKFAKSRVGEKTPGQFQSIEKIIELYPDAKIVCMVRDPYAVAASTINSEFGSNHVLDSAIRWKRYSRILSERSHENCICIVRYEDLVLQFEREIPRVATFLDIELDPAIAKTSRDGNYAVGDRGEGWAKDHFQKAFNALNPQSIDKWKTHLSLEQKRVIRCQIADEMSHWGYAAHEDEGPQCESTARKAMRRWKSKMKALSRPSLLLSKSRTYNRLTYRLFGKVMERN